MVGNVGFATACQFYFFLRCKYCLTDLVCLPSHMYICIVLCTLTRVGDQPWTAGCSTLLKIEATPVGAAGVSVPVMIWEKMFSTMIKSHQLVHMSINISNRYAVQCHSLTFCDICHVEHAQNHKHPGAFPLNSVMFWFDYQFVKDCYEYCLTRPKLDQKPIRDNFSKQFFKTEIPRLLFQVVQNQHRDSFSKNDFFRNRYEMGPVGEKRRDGTDNCCRVILKYSSFVSIILESWEEVPYIPYFHIHFLCDFLKGLPSLREGFK